jgi:ubiquinone biosynthesis protein Coq4
MDIHVFQSHELSTVLRVLRTALNPQGTLSATERSFLDTYAAICGREPLQMDPPPIEPNEVVIEGSHRRKRLVQLSALAVLLSRPVRPQSLAFLQALATSLATHDAVIDVIQALVKGQRLKVRLLAMRRAMRVMFKEAWLAEGPWGSVRLFAAMALKAAVNKDKLWQYKRLGLLPEGTLGREYWKHMTEVGFGFPGDVAGIADSVAYHDVAHVLAGNDITPLGEIQQGSFQGGNRREDGFFFVQFVVLQFHHGVKVTPATGPQVGHFDPRKVLWAIHRGAQCNVDMTHQWNFWPLMTLPIDEARQRIALLPKLAEPATPMRLLWRTA